MNWEEGQRLMETYKLAHDKANEKFRRDGAVFLILAVLGSVVFAEIIVSILGAL